LCCLNDALFVFDYNLTKYLHRAEYPDVFDINHQSGNPVRPDFRLE